MAEAEMKISNPDKVLFPKSGITKQEYVEYYANVASYMVPHVKDRPLTMFRFPNGAGSDGFYQKEIPDYFPSFFKRVDVPLEKETKPMGMLNNRESLIYMANMVAVPHTWVARAPDIDKPDQIMWDLDPSDEDFGKVITAAKLLRYVLEDELKLNTYLKVTGSRGIHVIVPVRVEFETDRVVDFSIAVGKLLVKKVPSLFTMEMRKNKRGNKIFVDYLRNRYAQTAVAPFAVRAKEGAPVAAPVTWDEVESGDLRPDAWNIRNIFDRLEKTGDLWEGMRRHAKSIKAAEKRVGEWLGSMSQ